MSAILQHVVDAVALGSLSETFAGQDLGGVIVISDGIDTGALGKRVRRGEETLEVAISVASVLP